jgi:hypothetical protein
VGECEYNTLVLFNREVAREWKLIEAFTRSTSQR